MRTPFRKPFRDLRRFKVRSLTIVLMVALGLGTYAGLYMSRESLSHTRDTIYRSLHLSDVRVVTTPSDPSEIPRLEDIPGVEAVEKRLVVPGSIEQRGGRLLNALIVYLDSARRPQVNNLEIHQGSYLDPVRRNGVVIERSLAEYHGYRIGDRITLNPYTTPTQVEVVGIALSPECLMATSDATVFFPVRGSLGVIFASMELVEEVFGYPLYNEFSFLFREEEDPARVEDAILAALKPLGIEDLTPRKEEFAYRFLQEWLKGFSAVIPSLVLVFGVVIFLVTFISSSRLVASQRQEIGVLRSIGYRRREVLGSYVLLALTLSASGGLIGAAWSLLLSHLFASGYANALGLPRVLPVIQVHRLLTGWVVASGVVVLAFVLPLLRLVRLAPQQILRKEQQAIFTGTPRILGASRYAFECFLRPPLFLRYGVRNLLRRFGLTCATVACVALPVALGGAFFVVLHSVASLTREMFDREQWDVMINFRYPLAPDKVEAILASTGISRAVQGALGFGQVVIDDAVLNYQILGFPADRYPRKLDLVEGRLFRNDREKAILLNRNWMDEQPVNLRLGDWVEVRTGKHRDRLEIVGLYRDMTVGQAHVPLGTAQDLFGMGEAINGVIATLDRPVENAKDALYRHEEIGAVYSLAEIQKGIKTYQFQMAVIFYSAAGVSIVIAALFLLASVLLNLLDREMEFATLRALGYNRRLVRRILLTELVGTAFSAALLSTPLAVLLALFINDQQGKIYFPVPTVVRPHELLGMCLWALLFIPLGGWFGLRYLFRLNIAEVVRQKVMG